LLVVVIWAFVLLLLVIYVIGFRIVKWVVDDEGLQVSKGSLGIRNQKKGG